MTFFVNGAKRYSTTSTLTEDIIEGNDDNAETNKSQAKINDCNMFLWYSSVKEQRVSESSINVSVFHRPGTNMGEAGCVKMGEMDCVILGQYKDLAWASPSPFHK